MTGNKNDDGIAEMVGNRRRFIKQKYTNVWERSRDKSSTQYHPCMGNKEAQERMYLHV